MIHPEITSLYKYRGFNINSIKCLIDEVAWFSLPRSFNDPFDCGVYLDKNRIEETIRGAFEEVRNRNASSSLPSNFDEITAEDIDAFHKFRTDLYSYIQSIGVFSLTSVSDDILMWGHYSESHTGFCIEYDRHPDNLLGTQALPVIYQKTYPSLTGSDVSSKGNKSDHLWRTKSEHWSYEKEWRLIAPEGGKAYQFPSRIKSIIFGLKMKQEDQYTLRRLLEPKDVSFKKAVIDDDEFSINIVGA